MELFDHRRIEALKLMCKERVLLTTLVTRHVKMTEQFANSYVSAMFRAGEVLGHEELCDIVQDEGTSACSLLPHDILSDMSGNWDDPCRAPCGFSADMNANELTLHAHARAQIHKSLFKLQEKFDIKGGISSMGPYAETAGAAVTSSTKPSSPPPTTPRGSSGGLYRRKSSGSLYEGNNNTSLSSRFNPLHYSLPLLWDSLAIENMPYGRHVNGGKKGKRSSGNQGNQSRSKKARLSSTQTKENAKTKSKTRSTEAVGWSDVAKFFQPVAVQSTSLSNEEKKKNSSSKTNASNIFAPVFRELDSFPEVSGSGWSDSDDSDEEDISEEAVLSRHQVVLDSMKKKLDTALEAKQKSRK